MKILIVENERKVAAFIAQALAEQAYATEVAGSCAAARDAVAESLYDVVILDLGLPDGDGLDLLAEWRKSGLLAPVLILSARDGVADRISGLNRGADDYLPKPFNVGELVARVRSLLRRHSDSKTTVLSHHGLRLDLLTRELKVDGQLVELTNKEFSLVELFLQNPGRVLTRTVICERVWEASYDLETNLIDVYMRRLRSKLERAGLPPLFKTIRGSGYQLL